MYPVITNVREGSVSYNHGIKAGDEVVSINGEAIYDSLDFSYYTSDEDVNILIKRGDEMMEFPFHLVDEDLGISLCYGDGEKTKRCQNKCMFCFIDQMPKGMRETLYVKDDDVRLSFLTGSYITLTNLKERDIERIIRQRISPINISVHTVNPKLRVKMLHNRRAGDAIKIMKRLKKGKIEMNCQIVLVKGVNDGKELIKSLKTLYKLRPYVNSLSVVPCGITKHREGLPEIIPHNENDAKEVIDIIEKFNKKAKRRGNGFCYPSDEFYLLAKREIPNEEFYDGYPQIENGVGMIRSFLEEVKDALYDKSGDKKVSVGIITGKLAVGTLSKASAMVKEKFSNVDVKIYGIENELFGPYCTVAGLVSGKDVISSLKGEDLPEKLIMPKVMFKSGTEIMLDDIQKEELTLTLKREIEISEVDGYAFVESIIGKEDECEA